MAKTSKRLPTNVEGPCFVDSSCIDCGACIVIAPEIFDSHDGTSFVKKDPETAEELVKFQISLLSCPTNSIGDQKKRNIKPGLDALPCLIEENVYFCGFTSRDSYGAQSYFVKHPEGNWLIDSPSMRTYLAERFKELGGIKYIFLTHQDDVADAFHYAELFNASLIMHNKDAAKLSLIHKPVKGDDPVIIGDFQIIPTPGHTQGSMCLLYKNKYLFTGDHLYHDKNGLNLYSEYCWFDFEEQLLSVEKLKSYSNIEWILPAHGGRQKIPAGNFPVEIDRLINIIKSTYK